MADVLTADTLVLELSKSLSAAEESPCVCVCVCVRACVRVCVGLDSHAGSSTFLMMSSLMRSVLLVLLQPMAAKNGHTLSRADPKSAAVLNTPT